MCTERSRNCFYGCPVSSRRQGDSIGPRVHELWSVGFRLGERPQDGWARWRFALSTLSRRALARHPDLPCLRPRRPVPEGPRNPQDAAHVETGRVHSHHATASGPSATSRVALRDRPTGRTGAFRRSSDSPGTTFLLCSSGSASPGPLLARTHRSASSAFEPAGRSRITPTDGRSTATSSRGKRPEAGSPPGLEDEEQRRSPPSASSSLRQRS